MKIIFEEGDDSKDKLILFRIEITRMALERFNNSRTLSSKWIGISKRQIRNWIEDHEELWRFKMPSNKPKSKNQE